MMILGALQVLMIDILMLSCVCVPVEGGEEVGVRRQGDGCQAGENSCLDRIEDVY